VDKLLTARRNVARTTETLTDAMDSMTKLDEATSIAVETTRNMEAGTGKFADEANTLHENLVCHRKKLTFIAIGAVVVFIVLLIAIILGVMAANGAFKGDARRRMLRMGYDDGQYR